MSVYACVCMLLHCACVCMLLCTWKFVHVFVCYYMEVCAYVSMLLHGSLYRISLNSRLLKPKK